ncbi:IQ domain-containing protein E [Thalassophryne amazonica]|uniref:IQ domain-containing protein E n=1 Tax=Thalassophryne amazonica TaxID=390379 RepID=UPI001471F01A|nr:IQ domain-containing protein E [Thalassophryne amazonica]
MCSATAKISVEASDVLSDEEYEELPEESFAFSADISEKINRMTVAEVDAGTAHNRTRMKRSSGKPPSPRSPYLSSLNMNPRRAVVAAWRLPRASSGDTRGDVPGESASTNFTSLSNGHDLSQTMRPEFDVNPEFFKRAFTLKSHRQSTSNGFTFREGDARDKEDMYDEIIHLKKCLQAQKCDNHQMKVKLRRLEEENAKREKQIEELLDPMKGSEYTRSLVDKKKEGSVVLNGLKQRILKLEQQCREKESALSKLQSDLRTTNLEELKITVETYFQEIQRLRMLLESAEKSSRAESKCSQRQQKALSSTVLHLTENLKQLQQENGALREELNTDSPAGGIKGYREWSKQRLLRRLLEVEKRLEDSRRHAHSAKPSRRVDQEVQAILTEWLDGTKRFSIATEAVVSVGTNTEEEEEISALRHHLSQLEEERVELQEMLLSKDNEVRQLRTERDELQKETELWKAENTNQRGKERQEFKQQLDELLVRIQTLEDVRRSAAQPELSSAPDTTPQTHGETPTRARPEEEERGKGGEEVKEEPEEGGRPAAEKRSGDGLQKERGKAARIIQRNWREHRVKDTVMLQSALRAHLCRAAQLKAPQKETESQAIFEGRSLFEGREVDLVALTMIQSAFRGHLARCGHTAESSGSSAPSASQNSFFTPVPNRVRATNASSDTAHTELIHTAESGGGAASDSDDSDDIIVSPSCPLRSREERML